MNMNYSATVQAALKMSSTPCGPNIPFCGLGDISCLASRVATCSGMMLVEQPGLQNNETAGSTANS